VPVFYEAAAPSTDELEAVLLKIITRTMRILTRLGVVIEEPDRTYLAETAIDGALRSLQAASCTYRIALGPTSTLREKVNNKYFALRFLVSVTQCANFSL
jgi:hypothetical protein